MVVKDRQQLLKPHHEFVMPFLKLPFKYRSGYVKADLTRLDYQDQIFTFTSEDGRTVWHWHIKTLIEIVKNGNFPLGTMAVEENTAIHIKEFNGIESKHIDRIISQRPNWASEPGIAINFSDGTDVIVDGNHRYLLSFLSGKKVMNFWCLTEEEARPAELKI